MLSKNKINPAVGIFILLLLLVASSVLKITGILDTEISVKSIWLSELYVWSVLGLLLLYVHKIEKQNLLIWTEKKYPIKFYFKSIFKTILLILIISILLSITLKLLGLLTLSDKTLRLIECLHTNKLLIIVLPITAGITEELIIRAYLLTRLDLLFKNAKASIFISSLLFGFLHYGYGTFAQIIGPFFIGLVLATHYYKYQNIKMVVIIHVIWDFLIMLRAFH